MLSRIGNSLFWMGRFIERAEHVARYTKVHYVSSLDAPISQSRDLVLESILNMNGVYHAYRQLHPALAEAEVLYFVTLDEANPFSILSSIGYIRENARGTRDAISLELWEAINRFYHGMNSYTAHKFHQEGIFSFAQKVEENSSVLKGYIDNTLTRNETHHLICLGVHLERAAQITRILQTKLADIKNLAIEPAGGALANYQWNILLKSAESFDMHKRETKNLPNQQNVLEFLIFNPIFPKSILYNLNYVLQLVREIKFQEEKGSIEFLAGKIANHYNYLTYEEIAEDIPGFLDQLLRHIYKIARLLEEKYLNF